jgi:AraC-like DNA-binding protein
MVRENIEQDIDFRKLAADHYIGYSYFRKMFKKYTGMAPHQYHLDLKLMKAKEMILTNQKTITEISAELGFESIYYFSRLFKRKVGQNPSDFRK